MEGQKSQAKLTRTHSSLLRSSPTIRSSIPSLSSINEDDAVAAQNEEEQKVKYHLRASTPRTGSTRTSAPVIVITSVGFIFFCAYTFFFYLFYFVYLEHEHRLDSENLLIALIFISVGLYIAIKNKGAIHRSLSVLKHSWDENLKRLGLSKTNPKPVQWFIGDSTAIKRPAEKRIIREGVEFYGNGDFYEGEFHKGKCNGSGVYNYFANARYEGDWVDGRHDGYGIETWAKGSRYRGQYRQGLRHGYGIYRFYTGDSYAGEWCNGQSHGVGVQTCSDGSCYIGEFKYGVKHGHGCYHFRNGDRYAGEYFGDKIHGFGVYHFANGHCYEGAWHEGRRQGLGVYTFRNGDRKCGEWDAGNLIHPLPSLTHKLLGSVQAARKTAENAIKLRRVDEQVNKAIAAANRAATAARVAAVKAVQNRMEGKFCDTPV
ncbi:MORN repeat-containing protein 1 [Neltuma alba]|uniref:MORN repeat-containing protein 1 n=1 Tax=Neltuma alba TaxID=207710 RepID=UPI0010A2AF4C|nr:MORN repeat-containing protein 1-like [Prosopis alba]